MRKKCYLWPHQGIQTSRTGCKWMAYDRGKTPWRSRNNSSLQYISWWESNSSSSECIHRKIFSNKQYILAKVRFEGREVILKGKPKIKSQVKNLQYYYEKCWHERDVATVYFLEFSVPTTTSILSFIIIRIQLDWACNSLSKSAVGTNWYHIN